MRNQAECRSSTPVAPDSSPISTANEPNGATDSLIHDATVKKCFLVERLRAWLRLRSIFLLVSVAAWSVAGNASRLALQSAFGSINFFAGYEYFSSNCLGCLVMGLVTSRKLLPADSFLFLGLSVGYCGSLTTFSSWVLSITQSHTASGALLELLCGLTLPFIFFLVGRDVGSLLVWLLDFPPPTTNDDGTDNLPAASPLTLLRRRLDLLILTIITLAAVIIPITLQICISHNLYVSGITSTSLKAAGLGPVGASARYFLSIMLNKEESLAYFPVGTLLANTLAVIVDVALLHAPTPPSSYNVAVRDGVCGALSTVSTLVGELISMHQEVDYASSGRVMHSVVGCYMYVLTTLGITIAIAAAGRRG